MKVQFTTPKIYGYCYRLEAEVGEQDRHKALLEMVYWFGAEIKRHGENPPEHGVFLCENTKFLCSYCRLRGIRYLFRRAWLPVKRIRFKR